VGEQINEMSLMGAMRFTVAAPSADSGNSEKGVKNETGKTR
jgi:hypothetical protein